MALAGIGEGLAAAGAGYSTSTTHTNSTYNGYSNSYGNSYAYGSGGYAYGSYNGYGSYHGNSSTTSRTTTYDGAAAYQVSARNKTVDDFMALPEGTMIELIDGQFYDMAAPSTRHQKIAGRLFFLLMRFVDANGGKCLPMIAPTAVRLDRDNKTMVLPDVLVCCNSDQIKKNWIDGAPDFMVEILSPSNWYNDVKRKLDKYKNAGVREYWIINPEQRVVWVYTFEEGDIYKEYTFEDKIPVRIWNDKCVIDFKEISEYI